jgi:hypothetical protein
MRSVGNVVRTMPDNLLNTVDEVMDNITKVFINEDNPQTGFENIEKLGTIDIEVNHLLIVTQVFKDPKERRLQCSE